MNEGINLLDPNKNTGPAEMLRRLQKMRLVAMGLLFIISVTSVILFILVALSPLPKLQSQEQYLRQTLTASKNDIATLEIVKGQTDTISQLLTKRASLLKQVSLIQAKLTSDTTISDIQIDSTGTLITFESHSLQSLDTCINGLTSYVEAKNTFSRVTLVDLTNDPTTDGYAVTVQLTML
jgi:hypothetical protein